MTPKTKIIELSGTRYQLRKMAPDVGSFILMAMIGAGIKASNMGGGTNADDPHASTEKAAENLPTAEPKGEEVVRATAFSAFLGGLDFEMHRFIQVRCLSVCSRMEGTDGSEVPMPIVSEAGRWAIPEIQDDISLVMRLEVEALVFNLSPFFASGGLNAMVGSQVPA